MHQEPWWSAGHLLMLSRCIFNCIEFHMPLKTLFSKYDFSAHLLLSILTVPSIFGCIMETCFYLNLPSRILTLLTSLLYFQTTWFLFHHELYSCFTLASSFLCSTQLDFFLFSLVCRPPQMGISFIFFKDNKYLQHAFCCLTPSIFVDVFYLL